MRIAEQLAQILTESPGPELNDSAYDVMDRILSDVDRFITGPMEHELGVLKDALESAQKQIHGLAKAGAGRTEHGTILERVIMPAWSRYESKTKELGDRFRALQAKAKQMDI